MRAQRERVLPLPTRSRILGAQRADREPLQKEKKKIKKPG